MLETYSLGQDMAFLRQVDVAQVEEGVGNEVRGNPDQVRRSHKCYALAKAKTRANNMAPAIEPGPELG